MKSVTVSLDGERESHDWLRGVDGSFDRAIHAIELLSRASLPFFDVVTCVSPRNLKELPRVHSLLNRHHVPAWRLFPIFPRGRAKGNSELSMSPSEFRALLAFIERTRQSGGSPQTELSCEGYLPEDVDRKVRDEPYFCRAGICIGSVLCDGSISACPNISRGLIQGNVRTDDFMEVWEQRYQPFRQREWMKKGECRTCSSWRRCLGNSLHLWDETNTGECHCTLAMLRE